MRQEHKRISNVLRLGPFYSVQEVQALSKHGNKVKLAEAEERFGTGTRLPPDIVKDILTIMDECFDDHLMDGNEPVERFGSMDKKFTDKLRAYNIAVTNKVTKWQQDYERRNGPLGANLAGRIAWAIRPDANGNVPRPFLTNTFITALDMIFERISSFIREVHLLYI